MNAQNAVVFEGATPDYHETTLTIVDPTAYRTINLPNQSGTIPVLAAVSTTQISATPEELNIMDCDTSATSTTSISSTSNYVYYNNFWGGRSCDDDVCHIRHTQTKMATALFCDATGASYTRNRHTHIFVQDHNYKTYVIT